MKSFLLLAATAAMLSASSYAQPGPNLKLVFTQDTVATAAQNPQLVFTEESDTVLKAKLAGSDVGTVLNTGPDRWTWRIPASGDVGVVTLVNPVGPLTTFWAEPDSATLGNFLSANGSFDVNNQLVDIGFDIASDADLGALSNVHPNGEYGFTLTISSDLGTFGPVDVYFLDLEDRATVPDSGSTGLLLLGSLLGAAGFRSRTKR